MNDHETDAAAAPARGITRRGMLLGAGTGLGLGVLATLGTQALASGGASSPGPAADALVGSLDGKYVPLAVLPGLPVNAHGEQQAGIARPDTPQRHTLFAAFDLEGGADGDASASGGALFELSWPDHPTDL